MAFNLERFISNLCCNSCQSFYDYYVEANVRFRSELGMKAVIIRRQLGNCCDWCARLAGIYDPYNAPDDIYKRHENCRCLVTYKSQDGYQNVWNKKIFQTQKEARLKKIYDFSNEEIINKPFDKEKRKLLSEGKQIYDATNEWRIFAKPDNVVIREISEVRIDGKKYKIDGKHVLLDLDKEEKVVLNELVHNFGGIMEYHPRIVFPNGVSTPDCLYNGLRYDLKQPGKEHPNIRGDNVLFNMIDDKKEQAHCFIFDITRSGLSNDEAIEQAYKLFVRRKTKYVERIILYDGDFFKILERI